ncbi:MAG TPA: phosphate acyltransferase PlsX [Acidobacteriaceae bacterium]|jgi:glycerol-3-phosphate acyltransferase PlsX|nr:phosphate acyltransferase PlsX [Acidobacteriaceae bacterium]
MPVDIVLDAMGSDKAPDPEIRGALLAARQLDVRVHLVGPEDVLRPKLREALNTRGRGLSLQNGNPLQSLPGLSSSKRHRPPVFLVQASEWISMEDKAALAVRSKRDSSMRVGLKMVREGRAAGFVTAGNTGAAMATAKMVLGSLVGVDRPALATVLPTTAGIPCVLLDVGANVDCDANNLVQFALMGHMYAKDVLHVANPRVGLLSIGEEDSKGNNLTRDTLLLLRELGLNFIGNVEGRDLYNARADVVVCDGFVGNVALKASEGLVKLVNSSLRVSLKSTVTSQVGALLSKKAFYAFKKRLDYTEYGGAPLLGVRGVCIVGHGSSNDRAIMNGIRVAAEFAQADVNSGIEAAIAARHAPRV